MRQVVTADGKYSYLNNKLHSDTGPAVELLCGTNLYYKHGKLHSVDGPAIECGNGLSIYYIDGVRLSTEEFKTRTVV